MPTIDDAYVKAYETNTIILNLQTKVDSLSQYVEAYPAMTNPNPLTITLSDGITTIDNLKKQSDKVYSQIANFLTPDSSVEVIYFDGSTGNNLAKMAELASAGIANLAIIETSGDGNSYLANDGTYKSAVSGVQIDDTTPSDTTTYSSQKVENELSNKQDVLESGVNIKTINGQSILGSGDINTNYSPDLDPFGDGSQILYINFDNGVIKDEMGNYTPSATGFIYDTGVDGQCASFTTTTSYVGINPEISTTLSELALSMFVKHNSSLNRCYIFATDNGLLCGLAGISGPAFNISINNTSQYSGSSIIPDDGNFHHLVVTWSKTQNGGIPKAYVDGVEQTLIGITEYTSDWTFSMPSATASIGFANYSGSVSYDQIRFFTRMIDSTEVLQLKNIDLGV